jgi:hypothetical protein
MVRCEPGGNSKIFISPSFKDILWTPLKYFGGGL